MDRQLEQSIENIIAECLLAIGAVQMDEVERLQKIEQLRSYFLTILFKTFLDELEPEQIHQMALVDKKSEQFYQLLDEYMSEMPDILYLIDDNLQAAKEKVISSKQIPS